MAAVVGVEDIRRFTLSRVTGEGSITPLCLCVPLLLCYAMLLTLLGQISFETSAKLLQL